MRTYYFDNADKEISIESIPYEKYEWERDIEARKRASKTVLAKDDEEAEFIIKNPHHTDTVCIHCYNTTEYAFRPSAMEFYKTAMIHSEGSERERYTTIYTRLALGQKDVSDS